MGMDKSFWQAIVEAKYSVPDSHSLADMRDALVGFLGLPDPLWRDEFGYMILTSWITEGRFTSDDLQAMIVPLTANLKRGLGENGTDSVFLRSFSILILSELVYRDNEHNFLNEQQLKALLATSLNYCLAEKDLRGYLAAKGWAHSCAHTADMLNALATNRHMDIDDLTQILNALIDKLATITDYIYVHGEDERLTEVILSALKRELLTIDQWQHWLDRFEQAVIEKNKDKGFDLGVYGAKRNTKNFLRSVYLQLVMAKEPLPLSQQFMPIILITLAKFPY
jgi:hypothetical protein